MATATHRHRSLRTRRLAIVGAMLVVVVVSQVVVR